MVPETARLVCRVTFALVVVASMATELATQDGRAPLQALGWTGLWAALALLCSWLAFRRVSRPIAPDARPPWPVFAALLGAAILPFVLGGGYPLELVMVFALRNIGLGLAVCGVWLLCVRLACVVSLFLMLFAVAMCDHLTVQVTLGVYTAMGSVWLMVVYWGTLERTFVPADRTLTLEVKAERERLPWMAGLLVVGLVGCIAGLFAIGPSRAATVLGEWLPTSGGTGEFDPFARGGVNDGDDETQGDNPQSTGMSATESFLESPLPSLYDLMSDLYGEPFKPKDQEHSVALDPSLKVFESKNPADNLRPNREFAMTRRSPRRPRQSQDRDARALIEVQGRVPVHIRVTAYDAFDGRVWQEAPMSRAPTRLELDEKPFWMRVMERPPAAVFAPAEGHRFKVTAPLGALVPTPPHLERFRVGRVANPEFFRQGQDRIYRFANRKTPAGIIVDTQARIPDPAQLHTITFPTWIQGELLHYTRMPPNLSPAVAWLVTDWTRDLPDDWSRIAAVVERLRGDYTLDPSATVPLGCRDPLGWFLLESRRGPDYQFASAAAILVRQLGHPTRLVSGFYAAPEHYDADSSHTPVCDEDVHFWAEVMLPSGDWLVLEPTPGYKVLRPAPTLSERLAHHLTALAAWARRNALALIALSLTLGLLAWQRCEVLDRIAFWVWRLRPGRTWREQVLGTLRLLERRGRWLGQARPAGRTIPIWLRSIPLCDQVDLAELARLADWAAYSPATLPPWSELEVRAVCRRVLESWTLRRWRAATCGARS